MTYLPRQRGENGMVLSYRLETALVYAGKATHWQTRATGIWPISKAMKSAMMQERKARYIKFTALAGVGNYFSAAEVDFLVGPKHCPVGRSFF